METQSRRVTGHGLLALQELDLHPGKGRGRSTVEKQRSAQAASLPRTLLQRYERLRAQAQPPWVYRLADGACPCCRVKLPLQQVENARGRGEIIVCDYCSRLLIAEPPPMGT